MPEGETLPGRSGIITLFTDCIRRPADEPARDLPVIVLLGIRGSGKTWVLKYLRNACRRSVAIPYAFIDCADPPDRSVWRLIGDLADALHAQKWKEFGPLNFPRVTLGQLAAECPRLPNDLKRAQEELREYLRAPFKQHVSPIAGLLADILRAGHVPQFMINIIIRVIRFVAGLNRAVERLYRTSLRWYGTRFGNSEHSGLSALVELNRHYHTDDGREQAEGMLCEAFLDDLDDAFARRRKFNCVVLLDNCDDPTGTGFLNLLAELRSGRPGRDPLVVVAASRTVPALTGLDLGWIFPWEPDRPGASRMPNPDKSDYSSWQDNRASGIDLASWWYPVHLRDLTLTELRQDHTRLHLKHAPFIHQFTVGHPWSAYQAHRPALRNTLTEDQLLSIPVKIAKQAAKHLLADLPTPLYKHLVLWSAARDIGIAAAILGDADRNLRSELEKRLWLVGDNPLSRRTPGSPRLHPWLRRILLHELAAAPADWSWAHRTLRDYAATQGRKLDAAYHDLACRELSSAVDYLAGQFDTKDADSWIREFDAVTDAPSRVSAGTPVEHHEKLMFERGPLDDGPLNRRDRVRNTLWSMVAARWIWSDQLGDPKVTLKDTIADGYVRLADENQAGSVRYRREATAYREMKAW